MSLLRQRERWGDEGERKAEEARMTKTQREKASGNAFDAAKTRMRESEIERWLGERVSMYHSLKEIPLSLSLEPGG